MISTDAGIGTNRHIPIVPQQIELRAKIARVLQAAGYVVELAESQGEALKLAAGGQTETLIVLLKETASDVLICRLQDPRLLPFNGGSQRRQEYVTSDVPVEDTLISLTERERQITHLVSEGLSNKELGRQLNISEGTIKIHLHHIYKKLSINNRTALAALAQRRRPERHLKGSNPLLAQSHSVISLAAARESSDWPRSSLNSTSVASSSRPSSTSSAPRGAREPERRPLTKVNLTETAVT